MNWASWLLWGFLATIVLTTISAGTEGIGLTRMNFPYILGTLFTPNRDRAKFYGFWMHVAVGLVFSLIFVWIFQSLGAAGWGGGIIFWVCYPHFFFGGGFFLLPGFHPRVGGGQHGAETP